MKRLVLTALPFTLALVLIATHSLQKTQAAKPAGDAPATSTIGDIDQSTGTVYRIGSDSLGPYRNGVDSMQSIVQGIGDWELDALAASVRRVRFDFGDPVAGTGASAPFGSAFVPTRFISKCAQVGVFMPGMAVGEQVLCPLAIALKYNNVGYALRSSANYPGTESVVWTCLARNSTKCVSWRMVPGVVQADGQRKIRMQLLQPATRPRDSDTLLGQFYMSFDITVTTP